MPDSQAGNDTKEEKLKAALWHAIGQTVDSIAISQDLNATPHFIAGLSELVCSQIENTAQDLEAFAKHSGRSTISSKDAVLLGRRNEGLKELLQKEVDSSRERDDRKR